MARVQAAARALGQQVDLCPIQSRFGTPFLFFHEKGNATYGALRWFGLPILEEPDGPAERARRSEIALLQQRVVVQFESAKDAGY